jgi:hypothetical protein
MTTDRPFWRWLRRLGRIAAGFAIVAFGWLVVVVGLTFTTAPGRSIAIIGPPSQALAAIVVAEGLVLSSNVSGSTTTRVGLIGLTSGRDQAARRALVWSAQAHGSSSSSFCIGQPLTSLARVSAR